MNKKYLDDKELLNIPKEVIDDFRKNWKSGEMVSTISNMNYQKMIKEKDALIRELQNNLNDALDKNSKEQKVIELLEQLEE